VPFWEAIISGVVPLTVVALLKSAPFSINSVSRLTTSMCPFSEANRGGPAAAMHDHTSSCLSPCAKREENGSAVGMVDVMELILDPGLRRGGARAGARSFRLRWTAARTTSRTPRAKHSMGSTNKSSKKNFVVPSKKAVAVTVAVAAVAAPAVEKGELGRRSSWV
jgi:hypothetical protein